MPTQHNVGGKAARALFSAVFAGLLWGLVVEAGPMIGYYADQRALTRQM